MISKNPFFQTISYAFIGLDSDSCNKNNLYWIVDINHIET